MVMFSSKSKIVMEPRFGPRNYEPGHILSHKDRDLCIDRMQMTANQKTDFGPQA